MLGYWGSLIILFILEWFWLIKGYWDIVSLRLFLGLLFVKNFFDYCFRRKYWVLVSVKNFLILVFDIELLLELRGIKGMLV